MPDYEEAAENAGWVKRGTRWTHWAYPGKVYGNPREIYNEALDVEFKRPTSITNYTVKPPTVLPAEDAPEPEPEWNPSMGPHPDTIKRKAKVHADLPRRPRGRPPKGE